MQDWFRELKPHFVLDFVCERFLAMAQRRRSNFENSPTGLLVLWNSVPHSWLRTASEEERRTAGRLMWEQAAPEIRAWSLDLSRRIRNEADSARVMEGVRAVVGALRALHDEVLASRAARTERGGPIAGEDA